MKRILMTTALVALTSTAAFAESHAASGSDMNATMQYETQEGMQINASDLMGKTVYMAREGSADNVDLTDLTEVPDTWQDVADVTDILINADGQLESIVLDAGGFLGMGETRKTVALDTLKFVADQDDENEYFVVYTGDKQMLEDTNDYDSAAMEADGYTSASTQMEQAASDDTMTSEETAENEATQTETEQSDMASNEEADVAETDMAANDEATTTEETASNDAMPLDRDAMTKASLANMTADDLEGTAIYGSENDRVGEIGDLILAEGGQIEKVIVDVGGFLGLGERHVAMNLTDIELMQTENGALTGYISMTEEEIENMQEWEEAK
ncbi:PRC-barrel domain-containing protein [Sulfitobacter sp. HNIBRBA3233]|uniref:PRC-barrel domain-containing protein n=1 Tax=Sulfitobacter marinivivus TaxID=3158558 RepID=UPI0032DF41C0